MLSTIQTLYSLFVLLFVLQVVDILSTIYVIERMGGSEQNPAMKWVIQRVGLVPGLVIAKVLMLCAVGYLAFGQLDMLPSAALILLSIIDIVYVAVVGYNIIGILRK